MTIQMCGNALKLLTACYFIARNYGEFSDLAKRCCALAQQAINNSSAYLQSPREAPPFSQDTEKTSIDWKKEVRKGLDVADYLVKVGGLLLISSRVEKSDHSFLSIIIISHLLNKQIIKEIFDNCKQEETLISSKGASSPKVSTSAVNKFKQGTLRRRYSESGRDRYMGEISPEIRSSQEKIIDKIKKLVLSLGRFFVIHFLSGLTSPSFALTVSCFISDQRCLAQVKNLISDPLKKKSLIKS